MRQLYRSNFFLAEKLVLWMQHSAAHQTASILVAGTELPFVLEMDADDRSVLGLTGSEKFTSLEPIVASVTLAASPINTPRLEPLLEPRQLEGPSSLSELIERRDLTVNTPPDHVPYVSTIV